MKKKLLVFGFIALTSFQCLTIDPYMFAPSHVSYYAKTLNTLPESFISQVKFLSGTDTLYGFFVKAGTQERQKNMALVYFHGNLRHMDDYWERFQILHQLGFNLFMFDYRGFGLSQGNSKDETTLNADGEAALKYITETKKFPIDSVVLYGFSLGCVPALYVATKPDYEKRFPAVILESPFASANSLTQGSTGLPLPNGWLNGTDFDNVARVREWTAPLLVLGATKDSTSRFRDNAKPVFENSASTNKKFIVVESGHSHIIAKLTKKVYVDTLRHWFNSGVLPYKLK